MFRGNKWKEQLLAAANAIKTNLEEKNNEEEIDNCETNEELTFEMPCLDDVALISYDAITESKGGFEKINSFEPGWARIALS